MCSLGQLKPYYKTDCSNLKNTWDCTPVEHYNHVQKVVKNLGWWITVYYIFVLTSKNINLLKGKVGNFRAASSSKLALKS